MTLQEAAKAPQSGAHPFPVEAQLGIPDPVGAPSWHTVTVLGPKNRSEFRITSNAPLKIGSKTLAVGKVGIVPKYALRFSDSSSSDTNSKR